MPAIKKTTKKTVVATGSRFVIDATLPVDDQILDAAAFERYLNEHFKTTKGAKAGVLGEVATIQRDGAKITVTSKSTLAKRYIKYLTKRFLKKSQLRDYLRIISADKKTYQLRYFNIEGAEEEDQE
eukprot:TRINITY_DN3221_c0_g1_i1.p1 TRINITY_DN3221_c0_g1~~TRINITY_DN3221_c0_g1_i1.p1  ORF type:complete len:126 (+),score=72.20 TRINITY_DN3221_c0_g1_i1:92-469(+)